MIKFIDKNSPSQRIVFSKDFKSFLKKLPKELHFTVKDLLKGEEKWTSVSWNEARYVLVKEEQDSEKLRQLGASVYQSVKGSCQLEMDAELGQHFATGFLLAAYSFDKYLSKKAGKEVALHVDKVWDKKLVEEINHLVDVVYWTRDLVNEPVSFLTATQLAKEIELKAKGVKGMHVSILERKQIESLKMGGLLAVNKGSIEQPTFSIIEYKPEKPINKQPLVFVGKGVVYDTGGLSLKPTPNSMDCMKSDMGGAAMVAGAIQLIARQQLPVHVVALVPATDNRPGGDAYAPGDIIRMYNGLTVEVLNTDAEGRMILADALSYSEKFKPEVVIDAATLTGAAVRAIGTNAAISMGNADEKYFRALEKAGNQTHERVVQFPFWDEYGEEMKSKIADLKNLGGSDAGMITAGKFLENFVKSPYVHIDIAGPAWLNANKGYLTAGGTGYGVRLLYQFTKDFATWKKTKK